MAQKGISAFTRTYPGISRVLQSKASIGPAFNHKHSAPPPDSAFVEFDAIWDTGATGSAISQKVVQKCGLRPIGMRKLNTVNGVRDSHVYLVSIHLPNKVGFSNITVMEGDIGGADILIGMDIIGIGDFAVTNYKGKTIFSYQVPSVAKIDFVDKVKKLSEGKVRRNDPCPCGSGKKYKKCHGQGK